MFGYKKIKFDLTKEEIRELKEGRAGFLVDKENRTAIFQNTEKVSSVFRDVVKTLTSQRPIEQIDFSEPLEIMKKNGWLFIHSYTYFGYIRIDEFANKVRVYINTRDYRGK